MRRHLTIYKAWWKQHMVGIQRPVIFLLLTLPFSRPFITPHVFSSAPAATSMALSNEENPTKSLGVITFGTSSSEEGKHGAMLSRAKHRTLVGWSNEFILKYINRCTKNWAIPAGDSEDFITHVFFLMGSLIGLVIMITLKQKVLCISSHVNAEFWRRPYRHVWATNLVM